MSKETSTVTLDFQPKPAGPTLVTISGAVDHLHQDPKKIQQLLDLLQVPKGTNVRVLTTATSSIVR